MMVANMLVLALAALMSGRPLPADPVRVPAHRVSQDDGWRERLREAAPRLLEGSPGRGLPQGLTRFAYTSEVWPAVGKRCSEFEASQSGKIKDEELLAIAGDTEEDPRAREVCVWMLAARLTQRAMTGRPVSLQQMAPIRTDGMPGLHERLASFLESSDRVTRVSATAVVGEYAGPDAAETLVRIIKSPYRAEAETACRAIGRFGTPGLGSEGLGVLRPLIYDRTELGITGAASRALLVAGTVDFERTGATEAIDELIRALRYAPRAGEPRDRRSLAEWDAPGRERVIGFSPEEIASGQRTEAYIRYCAAAELSRLDVHELQRRAFPAMLEALRDGELGVVDHMFRFLTRVGARAADMNATEPLSELLSSPDGYFTTQAAVVLSTWGERVAPMIPRVIDATEAAMKNRHSVFFHLWVLGNSGDERAEQYLVRLKTRLGPETHPLGEDGGLFNTDTQYAKLIDDGVARIRSLRDLHTAADPVTQQRSLDGLLADRRRLFMTPTLVSIIKDPTRDAAVRERAANALRVADPVGASYWSGEILVATPDLPASIRRVLEMGAVPRREDE